MDYTNKKIIELRLLCSQRKIRNFMKMKKDKLISMLEANDKDSTAFNDPEFDKNCRTYSASWRQNNPERLLGYRDKFRESIRLNYHDKKQAAKENLDLDRKDYKNMSIHELQHIGRVRKIKYFNAMHKDKLIEMLKINDEDPSVKSDPEFDKICKEGNLISCRKHREKKKANNQRFLVTVKRIQEPISNSFDTNKQ